jgi:hypothetical protein
MTIESIIARKHRILAIEKRDANRFKPSPLGPGYLTRRERYTELYRMLDRRAVDSLVTEGE